MARLSIIMVLFVLSFSFVARAQETELAGRNFDEAKETEIAQKARKRLYPGGRDESDLKVQAQWTNPARKMAPSLTVTPTEPAEPGADD